MRNTSIEAYHAIVASGVLPKCRMDIYEILFHHGPLTQNEVEERLIDKTGAERRSRSGHKRFSELERQGAISITGERKCSVTGMNCKTWDVTANVPEPLQKTPTIKSQLMKALAEIAELKAEIIRLRTRTTEGENGQYFFGGFAK